MRWLARAGLLTTGLGMASCFLPAAALHAQPPAGRYPAASVAPQSIRWEPFARSAEGRPLEMAQFGSGSQQILVIGSLAGDDAIGRWMAERLAAHLARFPRRLDEATVVIVRDGNPDGRARRSSGNARGIELDQNFPTGDWRKIQSGDRYTSGVTPLTEPETRALAELVKDVRPDRVILLADGTGRGSVACVGSDELARRVHVETGVSIVPSEAVATSGSLAAWAGKDQAITTVLLNLPPRNGREDNWNELKRSIMMAMAADDGRAAQAAAPAQPDTAAPPDAAGAGVAANDPQAGQQPPHRVPALTIGQVHAPSQAADRPLATPGAAPAAKPQISAEALRSMPRRVSVLGIRRSQAAAAAAAANPIDPAAASLAPTAAAEKSAAPPAAKRPLPYSGRATPVPRGLSKPGNTAINRGIVELKDAAQTPSVPPVTVGRPAIQRLPKAADDHGTIRLPQEPIPIYPRTGQ